VTTERRRRRARVIELVPEDGQWTARHAPTGVASCGDTPAEALRNLRDAVRVYRATVRED
jgi:predicted RNase H-like HicB family nuclease